MRLRSWCRIGVLFPVKLSSGIVRGETGSNKVSSQTQLVILILYFIAFGFPPAMEVIEPINAHLVRAICDFIQHARTTVSREAAIANSQCDFLRNVICAIFFSKIRHRVASPLKSYRGREFYSQRWRGFSLVRVFSKHLASIPSYHQTYT